jgi:hypothetical protein
MVNLGVSSNKGTNKGHKIEGERIKEDKEQKGLQVEK